MENMINEPYVLNRNEKVELVKTTLKKHIDNALKELNEIPGIVGVYGTLPYLTEQGNSLTKGVILVKDHNTIVKETKDGFEITDRLYVTGIDATSDLELGLRPDDVKQGFTGFDTIDA